MKNEIKSCWLWPDHVIGGHESRQLREEHNALANDHAALLAERDRMKAALQAIYDAENWLNGQNPLRAECQPGHPMQVAWLQASAALAEGAKPQPKLKTAAALRCQDLEGRTL